MKRVIVMLCALALISTTSCDTLPFVGGGDERTVRVDFSHDEYSASFFYNFPKKIAVTPGTNLVFRQTWTGEPHTVTGGTLVDKALDSSSYWTAFFEAYGKLLDAGVAVPVPEEPSDEPWADVIQTVEDSDSDAGRDFINAYEGLVDAGSKLPPLDDLGDTTFSDIDPIVAEESEEAFDSLPFAFGEEEGSGITQNVGQPCYLRNGKPPEEEKKHCKNADQMKPKFDGKHSYYNSGIIPYEGPEGNTFEVPLAEDIDPGKYWFYCAVHGAFQATEVEVLKPGAPMPSQAEVDQRSRREIDEFAKPLLNLYRQALRSNRIDTHDELNEDLKVNGPFAGISDATIGFGHALINEFVPKLLEVKASEPITWRMMGSDHTISFGVPRYFPIMEFLDDGTVRLNPRIDPPAGGAKEPPEQEGMGLYKVDGGTYDGTGFWSSGLLGGSPYAEYTMRISKPGTYDFACLIHPPMVGKVIVT